VRRLAEAGALLAALLVGCEDDEIRRYRVRTIETPIRPPLRTLAAVVPKFNLVWFVKMMGPGPEVEAERARFEAFVLSLRFPKRGPRIEWTEPEGWTQGPARGMRFATFFAGSKEPRMEVSVTPLGPEAGSVLGNVNRWRRELGLSPIDEARLGAYVRRIDVDGGPAMIVDLSAGEPSRPRSPLSYMVPDGWTEITGAGSMRVAAFSIDEGGRRAEATIVVLGGDAGGVAANVNRWRGQIGLAPVDEVEVVKGLMTMRVSEIEAKMADLTGSAERILAVIVSRSGHTWFFKLQGPGELVARNKEKFESFLSSVRFEP